MEQSEKMINNRIASLDMIAAANTKMLAQGNHSQIYSNLAEKLDCQFETGLLRWRRGKSPVADMNAALETSGELLEAIDNWSIPDSRVSGYGYVWDIVREACFLLGKPVPVPADLLNGVRRDQSRHAADLALHYHILDALEGQEWKAGLPPLFERLASKKRQMLAVETYQTYFALLETEAEGAETEALVRQAEANYKRRAKDAFYSGGPTYMGGGPDNPYVVDFTLAAILKKIGWQGESIHRWRWDY